MYSVLQGGEAVAGLPAGAGLPAEPLGVLVAPLEGFGGWSCWVSGLSAGSFGDAGEWLPGWRGLDGAGRCHSRHGVRARNPESGRQGERAGHPFLAWP